MARRDMTPAEFRAALKRNGFRCILGGWIERVADDGKPRMSVGCVLTMRGGSYKLDRRLSIQKAIREFKKHDAKQLAVA